MEEKDVIQVVFLLNLYFIDVTNDSRFDDIDRNIQGARMKSYRMR